MSIIRDAKAVAKAEADQANMLANAEMLVKANEAQKQAAAKQEIISSILAAHNAGIEKGLAMPRLDNTLVGFIANDRAQNQAAYAQPMPDYRGLATKGITPTQQALYNEAEFGNMVDVPYVSPQTRAAAKPGYNLVNERNY